ncbi:MAG: hypothetical protein V4488_01890 [Pseudomonadota bacterium]
MRSKSYAQNSTEDKEVKYPWDMPTEHTKMKIATEIYRQMKEIKGISREEILQRFMTDANVSKAGAPTYFRLIKAAWT